MQLGRKYEHTKNLFFFILLLTGIHFEHQAEKHTELLRQHSLCCRVRKHNNN